MWPLATGFVDRLILMHGLETSDNSAAVLEESYRVLGPGGRALFIVPNRADWEPCWPVIKRYLGQARPASTLIHAGLQTDAMKIEIEVTAKRRKGD